MSEPPPNLLGIAALNDPAARADPYPIYHRMRTEAPLLWDASAGLWLLTRYADVHAALRDPRLGAERLPGPDQLRAYGMEELIPLFGALSAMMVFTDPPRHTRLRGLVTRAFTPRRVEAMRAHIQAIVDRLLDAVQAQGRMDIIRDLAAPLPTTVIAEMLGAPPEDHARIKRWSDDFAVFLGGFHPTPLEHQQALSSVLALTKYFSELVAERRRAPRGDLLSALAGAEEQGDMLSETELLATAVLLLVAGHETTTHLIGNGTLALLRHPDQLQALRENPSLIAVAVEELLRYDSPVQGTARVAHEPLTLDGRSIAAGQSVFLFLGAANRDPAVFPDPDRLDVTRPENRHLTFGHGAHFCLGAPLARLEGQIALGTLLRRMPELRLTADTAAWRDQFVLRGLQSLPVVF